MPDRDSKPSDFDSYWQETLDTLSRYAASPEIEVIPMRCTDFATMYAVRLTSLGPYRLFAYLSVPNGEGTFPARYYVARYGSVLEPIPQGTANLIRSRYVVLSLGARGQRNSDQPFAAMFPGLLTEGIDDPRTYVFRGIVADCVRGLQFLLERPEVDRSRVVAVGNDLALITSSLHEGVTHIVCAPALFFDTARLAPRTDAYPLEEINDYLRLHPEKTGAVHGTLAYFDLRRFAPRVTASTLLMAEAPGGLMDGESLDVLSGAAPAEVTTHESERSTYKDGLFTERWITAQFGFAEPIVPEHWR